MYNSRGLDASAHDRKINNLVQKLIDDAMRTKQKIQDKFDCGLIYFSRI